MSRSFDEILNSASLPTLVVPICFNGEKAELVERARAAIDAYDQAKLETPIGGGSLSDPVSDSVRAELETALHDAEEAAAEFVYPFRLRGLTPLKWDRLVAANPPRDGHTADKAMGYNVTDFFYAIARACIVDPDVTDSPEGNRRWENLKESLSSGQFERLWDSAVSVSRRKVDVPFWRASSDETPPSEAK